MKRRQFCIQLLKAGGAAMFASLIKACSLPEGEVSIPTATTPTGTPATDRPTATPSSTPTTTPVPTVAATASPTPTPTSVPTVSAVGRVAIIKTQDRIAGTRQVIELLGVKPAAGKDVLLKPNLNSADEAPGATNTEVLREIIVMANEMGARKITIADRSGMGNTTAVMEAKGLPDLAREFGLDLVAFDNLADTDFAIITGDNFHWPNGFAVPKMLLDAECVIQTCCLKTHAYGGQFTLSLKNAVGFVPGAPSGRSFAGNHNYMRDLHASSDMRLMIAEINTAYEPALIVMDGVEAFVRGGPATGDRAQTDVMLASTDRVAIDAIGVAILRLFGTTPEVSKGPIFEQEQIARAVELGLGVDNPEQIEIITGDAESESYAERIRQALSS